MKKVLWWIVLWIGVAAAGAASAQTEKELADEYFKKDDCVKAISYYARILKDEFDITVLRNYALCASKTKIWGDAEQFFKKQIKNDASNASWYYLYWGSLLEDQGKSGEALKR